MGGSKKLKKRQTSFLYAPLKYVQRLAVTKKLSKTGYHIALRKNLHKQGLNKDIQAFQKQRFFSKLGFS